MIKLKYLFLFFFNSIVILSQHNSDLKIRVDFDSKKIEIQQILEYNNVSKDTLYFIYLNDWNNSYSSKNSALGRRFSDEFSRTFHIAPDSDRGHTEIKNISDEHFKIINWIREENQIDIVKIELKTPIPPHSKQKINLSYSIKLPNEKFTRYGFTKDEKLYFRNFSLIPSVYFNGKFVKQSFLNLDDAYNAPTNYRISLEAPIGLIVSSNLELNENKSTNFLNFTLQGNNRNEVTIIISKKNDFTQYKNEIITVVSSLNDTRLNDIQKTIIIDKITRYVNENLGTSSVNKILVSQEDYDKQPFYGLNQLPDFLSPFSDENMFELMFLKTYLNNYLNENLKLNHRTDNWVYDAIQMFYIRKFINENNPDLKMMGSLASFKLFKSYNIINIDFNNQYDYLYLLMARKNLDQALNASKDKLIKFNEQISSKYKAGIALNYLDSYLGENIVQNSINEFITLNSSNNSTKRDFEKILKKNSQKNIDWFFNTLIESRDIIDFKFGKITKTDSIYKVKIINKSNSQVPIPVFQLKKDSIIGKTWIENFKNDTIITFNKNEADKLVLNYLNEVPEYNLRNNWKSLKKFYINNKPLKFNLYKDLEDPHYNQIFYVPEFEYNLYDGLAFGIRLNNKSILNKPLSISATPFYSPNTGQIVGKFSGVYDQYVRDEGKLYRMRFIIAGSQFHYAENAAYTNFSPVIQLFLRDPNFRTNKNEFIQLKQLYINRESIETLLEKNSDNYSIFNLKYGNFQSEITKHYSLLTDLQIANSFGKVSTEIKYRKLFNNNRSLSLRLYAGAFMFRSTKSEFFSFGIDRPTDYMFEEGLLGRSESTGIYSQQFVYSEGGFKSKFNTRFANQWITTVNASFNIWNWIQIYGDIGLYKNKYNPTKFIYDSGLHLNLVPDYFELFFPVYSTNGYELNTPNYGEKIRFVVTLTPKTLVSLFTRRWF